MNKTILLFSTFSFFASPVFAGELHPPQIKTNLQWALTSNNLEQFKSTINENPKFDLTQPITESNDTLLSLAALNHKKDFVTFLLEKDETLIEQVQNIVEKISTITAEINPKLAKKIYGATLQLLEPYLVPVKSAGKLQ
jgi:ankyrin repeat protein